MTGISSLPGRRSGPAELTGMGNRRFATARAIPADQWRSGLNSDVAKELGSQRPESIGMPAPVGLGGR